VQTRRFAFCAEMNVRFLNPMSPGATVQLTAELVANRKGRIYEARGMAHDANGQLLAESTGKYLPIKNANVAELAADFVGDPAWLSEKAQV
jgi:acyl-coenzyme A thioesterase PaaI-like protein